MVPVRGVIFPIFTIDFENCLKKESTLLAYLLTSSMVALLLVNKISSELSKPFPATMFLKYWLSNLVGLASQVQRKEVLVST